MNILANDGISEAGKLKLEENGFTVVTETVEQSQLIDYINKNDVKVLLVRSATKVRKDIIDACSSIKIIGRGGVGMDNIDVDYAKSKGIEVINTPAASSISVAELAFAHLLSCIRFLSESNRNMPLEGDTNFKELKKSYAKGVELKGKTIGVIGTGRIGIEVIKIALGMGMNVLVNSSSGKEVSFNFEFFNGQKVPFTIKPVSKEELLKQSDFVTLHIPAQEGYIIGDPEFKIMKKGATIINVARGGVIDEVTLVNYLNDGHIAFAGLDVFEKEPTPEIQLLMNPKLSITPHIGGATVEAQARIGTELADKIINSLK